jgi:hypothetical protein
MYPPAFACPCWLNLAVFRLLIGEVFGDGGVLYLNQTVWGNEAMGVWRRSALMFTTSLSRLSREEEQVGYVAPGFRSPLFRQTPVPAFQCGLGFGRLCCGT